MRKRTLFFFMNNEHATTMRDGSRFVLLIFEAKIFWRRNQRTLLLICLLRFENLLELKYIDSNCYTILYILRI
jgi:hypothetical protein